LDFMEINDNDNDDDDGAVGLPRWEEKNTM
jgi:hypothetical protein